MLREARVDSILEIVLTALRQSGGDPVVVKADSDRAEIIIEDASGELLEDGVVRAIDLAKSLDFHVAVRERDPVTGKVVRETRPR